MNNMNNLNNLNNLFITKEFEFKPDDKQKRKV